MKGDSIKLRHLVNEIHGQIAERMEIPERYRWKLEDMYGGEGSWENDYKRVKAMLKDLSSFKDKLAQNPQYLLNCLMLRDGISSITDKLYVYSHMRRDENNANTKYQALSDRAEGLNTEVNKEFSFIIPEILTIPEERIKTFMEQESRLGIYRHHMDEIMRMKEHILSPDQERIVSMAGDVTPAPENIYRMFSSADMKFPSVMDENGNDVELSEGRYYQLIRSKKRDVRKAAFEKLYSTYRQYGNTFAALLNSAVKKDIFYARVKKYGSSLEAALDDDNVPVKVYENIIDTVNSNLKPLHRYVNIRKRLLGLDCVHMYDLYTPLVMDMDMTIPYEEGTEIVEKALKPLGQDYISTLVRGFNSRWVDVFENKGKTHGAYSWGAYGTHPYVLLNYNSRLSDVSTLAHEMGHSIHSYLSRKYQPYVYSNYTLFSAEVASTTNEALLMNYFLKTTKDKKRKVYIINQYLESIRTTVYRQTMFAEFEKIIHEKVESGEALTSDLLCSIWHEMNIKYFGPDAFVDDEINMEWARIAHFYWNFYVYKYVTGFSAATHLSQKILEDGRPAVSNYINFLKSGDSDYSINLLKSAGVDMTTPEPLVNTLKVFEGLLDELEKSIPASGAESSLYTHHQ